MERLTRSFCPDRDRLTPQKMVAFMGAAFALLEPTEEQLAWSYIMDWSC